MCRGAYLHEHHFSTKQKGTISLNDLTGKELYKAEMDGSQASYVIPTASLANGTYLVIVHLGSSIQTSKITIMH